MLSIKCKVVFILTFRIIEALTEKPLLQLPICNNLYLPSPDSQRLNYTLMDGGHCILDGNADAVEFCPHDPFYNVLAASTYVLQEGDRPSRLGCITLFDVDADAGRLELIQKVETAGIFDIKWSPVLLQNPGCPLLAQADADGYVRIYSLQGSDSDDSETIGKLLFRYALCGFVYNSLIEVLKICLVVN
ncbi:hypothetical protein CDL12_05396 [Handroanthus impetiginosus]|uniref:Uncharacterized protein n=1 Tax=Handroanthus impetiginosus TaxID=429701 RepID=A0A2G9HWJ9_9LAMI|nr:hypothetical protein CDL12_05396 [Handroanthus impetiginosus]